MQQVGLPFHWGYSGLVKGDIGNDLVAISEEPNVRIMETKGILCNVVRGRAHRERQVGDAAYFEERTEGGTDADDRISDGRDDLHRVQGVRSRVQGME